MKEEKLEANMIFDVWQGKSLFFSYRLNDRWLPTAHSSYSHVVRHGQWRLHGHGQLGYLMCQEGPVDGQTISSERTKKHKSNQPPAQLPFPSQPKTYSHFTRPPQNSLLHYSHLYNNYFPSCNANNMTTIQNGCYIIISLQIYHKVSLVQETIWGSRCSCPSIQKRSFLMIYTAASKSSPIFSRASRSVWILLNLRERLGRWFEIHDCEAGDRAFGEAGQFLGPHS